MEETEHPAVNIFLEKIEVSTINKLPVIDFIVTPNSSNLLPFVEFMFIMP